MAHKVTDQMIQLQNSSSTKKIFKLVHPNLFWKVGSPSTLEKELIELNEKKKSQITIYVLYLFLVLSIRAVWWD